MRISDIEGATPRKIFRDKALPSYNLDKKGFDNKKKIIYENDEKNKFLRNWTKSKENFIPKFIRDTLNIDVNFESFELKIRIFHTPNLLKNISPLYSVITKESRKKTFINFTV